MSLPEVKIQIQDGALGQVPASNANVQVKLGIAALGIVGLLYSFSDVNTALATLGQGPLLESIALALAAGGGPVFAMPLKPTTAGSNGAVTKTSPTSAAGTVTPTAAPFLTILLKIEVGGVNGTMTFRYSVGGSSYSAVQVSTGGTFAFAVPGTLTTATFAAAQTWVAADVYTLNTDGTITRTGTGPVATNVTQVSSPVDTLSMLVTITTAGALGAAQFTHSEDAGVSSSGAILVPSGGVFVIPGTGIVLTFASTFGLNDTFAWSTTTATFSNTDVTNGLTTLLANAATWGWVHIVGMPSSAANAASLASTVDTQMFLAEAAFRFVFGVTEAPTIDSAGAAITDSTLATAFGAFASTRIMAAVSTALMQSPTNGRQLHRPAAWAVTARLSAVVISEEPSFVGRGNLKSVIGLVSGIDRDETATPFLDAARFCTLRTLPGLIGTFVTRGTMMAQPGSDFNLVSRRRVMDVACATVRAGLLPYLNGTVRVGSDGLIDDRDAKLIENKVQKELRDAVVATGDASDATVALSRTANILSTRKEPVTVRVEPLAILEEFDVNIGFVNPVLTAQLGLAA